MERNPALDSDIEMDEQTAGDVKGGAVYIHPHGTVAGVTYDVSPDGSASVQRAGLKAGASKKTVTQVAGASVRTPRIERGPGPRRP